MQASIIQEIIQLAAATLGSVGFGIVFNIQKDKLPAAALGGFISWASYLVLIHLGLNEYICGFLAAAITTAYSEIIARVMKAPAIVFVVVSTVPLIPGAGLYRSMYALLRQDPAGARAQGFYALLFATAMAAGIVLTTLVEKAIRKDDAF